MIWKSIMIVQLAVSLVQAWDYGHIDEWKEDYFYCNGSQQSPINIDTSNVSISILPTIAINENPGQYVILNNGDTVMIKSLSRNILIDDGEKETPYIIDQFHFHWGHNNNNGSEHRINGKQYPLEMHILAYQSKYETVDIAMHNRDGLLVLAFLFKNSYKNNKGLQKIVNLFPKITVHGKHYKLPDFNLSNIIPLNIMAYFQYYAKNLLLVGDDQLRQFLSLPKLGDECELHFQSDTGNNPSQCLIGPNFRNVQPINYRYITANAE
ncbi:hypothetical protein GJ496_007057 [Pomphorhynchus laevis]|nr:hypothetical protein GJ496_007057 [Pomphorhynchus laevis]